MTMNAPAQTPSRHLVHLLVPVDTGYRPFVIDVTFRSPNGTTATWLLTKQEASELAVQLTGAVLGLSQ